jgi:hypothetical protein
MKRFLLLILLAALCLGTLPGEEGMWTFDNPPAKQLKEKYNFEFTQGWLDHLRMASVRFMDGGSGSFVSPDGLILTNHHVAMGQLQKMSTAEKNYVATGFYAAAPADEIQCTDLELNVLMGMENVSEQVLAAAKGKTGEAAVKAREAEIARIEKAFQKKTGLTCQVVDLYRGGEYWVYQYKKYTDVRLVMAPERPIAYFGGDNDNFTYPRYDLDFAFFRAYENGKPIKSPAYLKWNRQGAGDGELVFVSGHPGSTNRLNTYAQMEFQRDVRYPLVLKMIKRRLEVLYQYADKGQEQARRALGQIFGLENAKKAMTGEYQGLLDKGMMETFKKNEDEFRRLVASKPEWQQAYGKAWDDIARVSEIQKERVNKSFLEGQAFGGRLPGIATQIVFYIAETPKPDGERLAGYHDTDLEQLKFRLFSKAPIYFDLEEATWAAMLEWAAGSLDADDPYLQAVLDGKKPAERVKELLAATKLADVDVRKKLIEGGKKALDACQDPLIAIARKLEPLMREEDKWNKENISGILTPASEKVAAARFAVYGKDSYPDATFTLRLTYGSVKGYPMNGTIAPYKTTLYGLYDRSLGFDQKGDFALPKRFWDRKDRLDLSTPVNFVMTCDIIGGNSGSPVVNAKGELVGLIFDGNIESLPGRFFFDMEKNRAVAVHSAYIMEAMRKLYDANALADEIEGQKAQ